MPSIKLGELLVKARALREDQLKTALEEQKRWGGKLGDVLVRMGFVPEETVVKALARQLAIPLAEAGALESSNSEARKKIPPSMARELSCLPLALKDDGRTLIIAMAEPANSRQLDALQRQSGCKVKPVITSKSALGKAFARLYHDEEIESPTGSFKVVNSQNETVVRLGPDGRTAPVPPAPAPPSPAPPPRATPPQAPRPSDDPLGIIRALQVGQRREVAALKAIVELLIEKGYFTREEYVAKLKRFGT